MRIRTLTFRGVGPYLDEQRIDFDQLGESGLYLINGPTGAGKSTIIDCICYALYGELAGDAADPSRMRSDFAQPRDKTEVDLTFETAAGMFRVIRTPEYMRARERGEGLTVSKTTCGLFRVHPDGTEQSIAAQVASANKELAAVIGLTRTQFVQTVVLPQGQFATFLYSDTRQRSEILMRIFNTQLYERVAEILKEDARSASDQKVAATDEIQGEIRQLATSIGLDEAARDPLLEFASNHLDEQLMAGLDTLAPIFEQHLTTASIALQEAQAQAGAADTARGLAQREASTEAALSDAAQKVMDATADAKVARDALAPTAELAAAIGIEVDDSLVVAMWRQRASAASTHAGELTAVLDEEMTADAWPEREAAAVQAIKDLKADHDADGTRMRELPATIAQQQAIVNARPTLDESTGLNTRKNQLGALEEQFTELDNLQAGLPALEERTKVDLGACERIDADLASASRAYRTGIAAELALDLEPGQPCAVCGATDHPDPARLTSDAVSFDDVESLRHQSSDAHVAVAASGTALRAAQDRLAEMAAAITVSRDEMTASAAELVQQEGDLKRRSEEAGAAAEEITRLNAERDELTDRVNKYTEDLAGRKSALDTTRAAMMVAAVRVAAARGPYRSVRARLDDVRVLQTELDGLADALTTLGTARARHDSAEMALAAMTQRDGFGDVDAAQSAWVTADEERLAADRAQTAAKTRMGHLRAGVTTIATRCRERAGIIAQNADLIDLAELFAAGRGADSGLHIYVLRALFSNVMECANRRFESLLNGRFRLVPAPESEGDGRRLQGLGVCVEDRLTGSVRPAKSLSGGETFCASLALALGLSDVVRMNAGGVEIGSLFIDEGFGSLDGDQLDEVMLMLGRLSSDGRLVGVISHVDSMKSAITERIDVTAAGENRPTSLRVSWMT